MSEIIAQTSSALAVDEDLTTLIDWVNIELFSGFTLIVHNAGGGSANDITDVTIDESDDAGENIDLDQHAATPAVPIAAGSAPPGTFTSTAKFVRVRAQCAAGEDTTASAYLLASSALGRLCLLADVKDRLGISNTDYDTVINQIIAALTPRFDNHCKRPLLITAADQTETYTGCGDYLQVDRYPIAAITSIKIATDYDFDSATALTVNTDYRLMRSGKKGIIFRPYLKWEDHPDSIQIVYRGGFCAAGVSPGTGETALPDDLREAAIQQASFVFKRRNDIGLSSVGFDGGSMQKFSALKFLPNVQETLDNNYLKPGL